jgi:exo-1,4-beta-D-glucosaminidase
MLWLVALAAAVTGVAARAAREAQAKPAAAQAEQKSSQKKPAATAKTPPESPTTPVPVPHTADETATTRLTLSHGWQIQSSAKIEANGAAISTAAFNAQGWYPTQVPTTVLAALVRNKVFPNPFYGMNLRLIPGTDYPIGGLFSHLAMPPDSPFRVGWWYRTAFALPASDRGRHIFLNFNGINYQADVWLNGQKIAGMREIAGTFRTFSLDITAVARPGAENSLAVEVFPETPDSLAWSWVDWNPTPPDKDMGLWRSVYITTTGPVAVRYPYVTTKLEMKPRPRAQLTVSATLANLTAQPVAGVLRGRIGRLVFEQPVKLAGGETRNVSFTPEKFRMLNFSRPRLWWPWMLGRPNLYSLDLEFLAGKTVSDRQTFQFGIRRITAKINRYGALEFSVNGDPVLIRGGGWAPDMLLRFSRKRTLAQIEYVRHLGLNTIRLEGKLIDNDFFRTADREGVLVMAGWCCCDAWQEWKRWDASDYVIAAQSLRSQIRRLRNHPSMLVWLNGSDVPPPPKVERMYLGIEHSLDWPNPIVSSASATPTKVTGPSGVKMTGPYNWVAPAYWWKNKTAGGAWGFNTETSPGPAPMSRASLERTLPNRDLWPINKVWNFHAGSGMFKTLDVFNEALATRYGKPKSLDDYLLKSQVMAYEGERAMFEAYSGNRYRATGVIQWMLNNAWPSLIWHLWDYYLVPDGGFYGTRKANEILHIEYDYANHSVLAASRLRHATGRLEAVATVYDLDLKIAWRRRTFLSLGPDAVRQVFTIPDLPNLSTTYFLDLQLLGGGRVISRNFYWLSTKHDAWDEAKAHYYLTPATAYADLEGLERLPRTRLVAYASERPAGDQHVVFVYLRNPSRHLAFFIHLRLQRASDGLDAVPVFWSDNDLTLLPGRKRTVVARIPNAQFGTGERSGVLLDISGWNVPAFEVTVHER